MRTRSRTRSGIRFYNLCVVLLLFAGVAFAAGTEAGRLFQQGKVHFEAGRYDEARQAFERAYALDPSPEILPNMGTANLRMKRHREALTYYELYLKLAQRAKPEERAKVSDYIVEARAALAAEAAAAQRAKEERERVLREQAEEERRRREAAERRPPRVVVVQREAPPVYRRGWFWGVLSGVAAAGVAAGVVGWYYSREDPLRGAQIQMFTFPLGGTR